MPLCLRFNPDFCRWTFVLIALDIALIFNGNLKIKWCKIIYCKLFSSDFFVKGRLHIKKWVGMTLIKAMYVFFFFFTRPFGYVFSRSVGEVFLYLVHWFVTFSYNSLWVPGIETPRTHIYTHAHVHRRARKKLILNVACWSLPWEVVDWAKFSGKFDILHLDVFKFLILHF